MCERACRTAYAHVHIIIAVPAACALMQLRVCMHVYAVRARECIGNEQLQRHNHNVGTGASY